MKTAIGEMKAELVRATRDAKDARAASLFAPATVKAQLLDAARRGLTSHTFTMTEPIHLRDTPAAERIMAWAEKSGLHCEWESRLLADRDGRGAISVHELTIRWDGKRLQPA